MSYGYALAGDGAADLRALEPWLQEEVIDELEFLAANPATLKGGHRNKVIYAFSRVHGQQRHHVTLTLVFNEKARMITALGVEWQVFMQPSGE